MLEAAAYLSSNNSEKNLDKKTPPATPKPLYVNCLFPCLECRFNHFRKDSAEDILNCAKKQNVGIIQRKTAEVWGIKLTVGPILKKHGI